VTIYVFSDFQCPYCREEAKVLRERVEKDHPNDVRLVFKDFPLESIHPWARPAAIAGECLAQQNAGTFWKFHDWIYQHQEEVNPENLTAKVQEFVKTSPPVDENKLSACMASSATAAHVDSTIREGRELGVVQTPTMFVNGRMVSGALSAEQMDSLVRMEMQHRQETVSSKQQASNEKCCEVNIPTATHN
jgi:protein-disulfide isomerase